MSQELTNKQIYRAVSNYLINDLGYGKEKVEQVIQQKIDDCMPEKLVEKAVTRYFGPYGQWSADVRVRVAIDQIIEKIMRERMQQGGIAHLNTMIQESLDAMFGRTPAAPDLKIPSSAPNKTVYPFAVQLGWTLMVTIVEEQTALLQKETGTSATISISMTQQINGDNWGLVINDLSHSSAGKATTLLSFMPDNEKTTFLSVSVLPQTVTMSKQTTLNLLSSYMDNKPIEEAIRTDNGILCLGSRKSI